MARISGIDLPREKRIEVALTYIYGIGPARAAKVLEITKRKGRVMVICENPKHKQRQG